jgi:hypothetical protein
MEAPPAVEAARQPGRDGSVCQEEADSRHSGICASPATSWRPVIRCMGMAAMAIVVSQAIQTYEATFIHSLHLGGMTGFVTLFSSVCRPCFGCR